MRKLVLSLFLFLVFHVVGITQVLETKRINNFNGYIDLGTYLIANFASINVEYNLIRKKENPKLLLRAGLSNALIASLFDDGKYYGGIVGLTYLNGKGNQNFELSGGVGKYYETNKKNNVRDYFNYPVFEIAYRYQNPDNGLLFRVKMGTLGFGIGIGATFYKNSNRIIGKKI